MSWSHYASGTPAEIQRKLDPEFEQAQGYLQEPEKHVHARVVHLIHVALAETKGEHVVVEASGHQMGTPPGNIGHQITIRLYTTNPPAQNASETESEPEQPPEPPEPPKLTKTKKAGKVK